MFVPNVDDTAFLLIDVQKRLVKAMDEKVYAEKIKNMQILLKAAEILKIPVIYTEQYVKGLGETVDELKPYLNNAVHVEKITFSCCGEEKFMEQLEKFKNIRNVVVFGMETHVCVLQTVMDLLENYDVFVVKDAVQSRSKQNWKTGLQYMSEAGAILTSTEIVLFMLLRRAKTDEFKMISSLVK
ncbi:MAG: isochorismatase hydrolase [Deferribacteraceae bacterium]|jgi:nicotinamidase-related amidase|nr:isochorismatase hydrolase [Deferribacteraceae bacterium]